MRIAVRILAGACGLMAGASLVGCVPPNARQPHAMAPLKPVAKLDCPDQQGRLTRSGVSADGKICSYSDGNEVAVQVRLTPLSGDAQATLSPIEAELRQMASFDLSASSAPPASDSGSSAPASNGHDQDVNINLPGIHIHAQDGGKANVNVGGIHIDADDKTNSAHIQGHHGGFMGHGGSDFTVDANDNGAIIRSQSMGPDVRQSLILASDKPGPEGWRVVGYEAQGPRSGPLVVAIVQSRQDDHERLFEDVKALVRKSAGG